MLKTSPPHAPPPPVRCRSIQQTDLGAVVDLLKRGFGQQRSRAFWTHVFDILGNRATPTGVPKFGNLLETENAVVVGVLLAIYSPPADDQGPLRCNFSSWYIEPEFRAYGAFQVSHLLKRKDVTYLNISPAPHTRVILEAQGFSCYSRGLFVSAPMLSSAPGELVKIVAAANASVSVRDTADQGLLLNHTKFGAVSLWCKTRNEMYPFVFAPRLVWGVFPFFQLVYCRDIATFVRFAFPIGRYLALRGRPLVILDTNAPIPGLVGRYFEGVRPKYFKGPNAPRVGDLFYTEAALFGV